MTTTAKRAKRAAKPSVPRSRGNAKADDLAKRKALVKSLRGSLSWVDYSVEQYLREKYAEVERENQA